ncbi:MAG: hypothetical protein AAF490_15405 [Chloroflexota bacterium]
MIEKPTIIVTSLGRTGTQYFAKLFDALLDDVTAVHEPDIMNVVEFKGVARYAKLWEKINEVGAFNILVKKPLGLWGLVLQSDKRFLGAVSEQSAIDQILKQRQQFIQSRPGQIYMESSLAFYGLLDLLPTTFSNYRAAYIVRNGRSWVQSWMNWGQEHGGIYGKSGISKLMGHNWPTAEQIPTDAYFDRWPHMSRFERLCWAWAHFNQHAIDSLEGSEHGRLFKFEDIFSQREKFEELIQFLVEISPEPVAQVNLDQLRQQRKHQSQGQFPAWEKWPEAHKAQFETHCALLMQRLNYE